MKTDQICPVCNEPLWLIGSFGKQVCRSCYQKKKHRHGHSGMLALPDGQLQELINQTKLGELESEGVHLERVPKGNKIFSTLYLTHYPKSKGMMGRSLCYLIYYNGQFAGIISGLSSPKLHVFNEYFGDSADLYNLIMNNSAFRLTSRIPNLGTMVLRKFRQLVRKDYMERFNQELIGLVTFVEPPLTGTVYKADNWAYLGMTKGIHITRREDMLAGKKYQDGTKKLIFGYKYPTTER